MGGVEVRDKVAQIGAGVTRGWRSGGEWEEGGTGEVQRTGAGPPGEAVGMREGNAG